jgi:hypothetical protein
VEGDSMEPRQGVFLRFKIYGHASNTHLVLLYVRSSCRSDFGVANDHGSSVYSPSLVGNVRIFPQAPWRRGTDELVGV